METFGPVLSIFLLLFVGYALRKGGVLRQSDSQVVNAVIIYGTVPALAFGIFYGRHVSWEMLVVVIGGNVAVCVNLFLSRQVARLLKLTRPRTGAFMLASSYGNTTFLGLPVVAAAFANDPQALVAALMFSELAVSLPVYTVGLLISSKYGGAPVRLKEAFHPGRLPAIPAIIAGLLLSPVPIPKPLMDSIGRLGSATVPLAMISVGLMLSARSFRGNEAPIAVAGLLKAVCLPLLVYAILTLCGIHGQVRQVCVLQAAMPTSIISGVIAARGGSDGPLVASSTLVLTLLAIGTLPLTVMLIR